MNHVSRVRNYMKQFIDKSFQSFSRNSKIHPKGYIKHILKSAQANTYVETVSNKADSLHRRIAWCLFSNIHFKRFVIQSYEFMLFRELGIPYVYQT